MQTNWHNGLLYPAIPFPRTYFATRAELKKKKNLVGGWNYQDCLAGIISYCFLILMVGKFQDGIPAKKKKKFSALIPFWQLSISLRNCLPDVLQKKNKIK